MMFPPRSNRRLRHGRSERPGRPRDDSVLFLIAVLLTASVALMTPIGGLAAAAARPPAPRLTSPADNASVASVPSLAWRSVRGAARYEFQLAADPAFKSVVPVTGGPQTFNTFGTLDKTLADGTYFWRARAINAKNRAGRWSPVRKIVKRWTATSRLIAPASGATVTYPSTPLVLRWEPVQRAYKYRVVIATDPSLAHSALGDRTPTIETSGTVFAVPGALAPGRYYWAVTPLDAEKHSGTQSAVAAFEWSWPTATTARLTDLNVKPEVFDPQFSWDPVPGAARYQVEVNPSQDFAIGSRVCCDEVATGTSLSPLRLLPNNTYYWRMRAIDMDGNAGVWNRGPDFRKSFDDVTPTIPGLRMRSSAADQVPAPGTSGLPTTSAPVVEWDPVPGASSYEVRIAPWQTQGYCDWTASVIGKPSAKTFLTATTAWAPLAPLTRDTPVGNAYPTSLIATDQFWKLWNAGDYCVRVRARTDRDARFSEIVSEWTQLGGAGNPAFTYKEIPLPPCGSTATPADAYHPVDAIRQTPGGPAAEMPLFTWDRVPGACGYFVVVARDEGFTKIVDIGYTLNPTYAPRAATGATTYADETTRYYWAVMPTVNSDGTGLPTQPLENNPQSFEKRSAPPELKDPSPNGIDVRGQPMFAWSDTVGAREYRIQVDDDPTFGSPLDDVLTNATAYTSSSTYPADTLLFWRVRANDENKVGLTWSATGSFRRRLPVPVPGDNPAGGESIPVLSWAPVEGAASYEMLVEQADGTKRSFTMRSTAFTPVVFYGTGVWHWQVRAGFKFGPTVVSGGSSQALPYTRRIATATGVRTTKVGNGAVLSWNPAGMARQYKVQISESDSFSTMVEQASTSNTSYAPKMISPVFRSHKRLYWRVAVVDEGFNAGGWTTSPLRQSKPMRLRLRGSLRHGRAGTVRATVKDARGRAIRGARVSVTGAGLRVGTRRTTRRGTVSFRLRPGAKGKVRFQAEKSGFSPAVAKISVK